MTNEALQDLLKELLQEPQESEWVEFKHNNSNPEKIGERLSALSNGAAIRNKKCGYLIYGVNDRKQLVGTNFNPITSRKGNEELEAWLLQRLSPRVDLRLYHFEYNQIPIAILEIPRAPGQPIRFSNIAYIRIGTTTRRLKDYPEKERRIWATRNRLHFGEGIAKDKLSAEEVLELLDHDAYFRLTGSPNPFDRQKILTKFQQEGFISISPQFYHITNLGAILFARDLKKFDQLDRKAVRVIQYKGNNKLETIREQLGQKGYAVGFEGLVSFINNLLPRNEVIGHALRENVKMYPELAIRELVANAIIHQEFTQTGAGPMIEIFNDRIEIHNPGRPIIDTLRFIDHPPISRNEKLAAFMRRINICEERGSGIDKVIFECEFFQLPAPEFIAEDIYTRATLFAHKELRKMDKHDKMRACYQHCCLKYVSNEFMTNSTLRDRFKIEAKNYAIVSRIISDTIESGLIKDYDPTSNSRKYAKYVPFWA